MSDRDDGAAGDTDSEAGDAFPDDAERRTRVARLRGLLDRAVLAGVVLLGFIAAIQFYLATGDAIRLWVNAAYRPVVRAAFNLALLLVAAAVASYQLRRLSEADSDDEDDPGPTAGHASDDGRPDG